MARLDRGLAWVENTIAAVALLGAVLLSIVGVILRYVFDYVIFWSEEASLYLIIVSTFVGMVIALRHNDHVGVELLGLVFGRRGKQVVAVLGVLVLLVYCAIFSVVGWTMVTSRVAQSFTTPALGLPLWVVQLSVPIGFTLLFIRGAQVLVRSVRGRDPYPDAAGDPVTDAEAAA